MLERTWAVVVNWNGGERNLACVRNLLEQGLAAERIVLVDNGSSDGSPEAVARAHPDLVLLRNAGNEGYGHANNRGVLHALEGGAEQVFLMNNDLRLEPGLLLALEAELARLGQGIVGPRVLFERHPERVWCAGGRVTFRTNLSTMIGHGRPDGPRYRVTRAVDYVPGCALLASRAVFERAGLLDGEYFAYHEDVDFCWKAKQAGFPVVVVGALAAYHDPHAATGHGYNARRKYMMGLNTVWFLRRHGTPWRWLSFLLFDVLTLPLAWLLRAPRGQGASVLAKARGTWDGLRGRHVTPERVARLGGELAEEGLRP